MRHSAKLIMAPLPRALVAREQHRAPDDVPGAFYTNANLLNRSVSELPKRRVDRDYARHRRSERNSD